MTTQIEIKKDPVLHHLKTGKHALLITGNILDLTVENETDLLHYRPMFHAEKLNKSGSIVLRYSRSAGLSVHRLSEIKGARKKCLDDVIQKHNLGRFLGNKEINPIEIVEIFRAFRFIACNKYEFPFVFIIDYGEHLTQNNHQSDREMQIVAECISNTACMPAAEKSGNCLLVYAQNETQLSPLLKSLTSVVYNYPTYEEYLKFYSIILKRPEEFATSSLPPGQLASLSRGLNFRQIADLFRAGKHLNTEITDVNLITEKESVIEKMTEGTLTVIQPDISLDDLAGLIVPKKIIREIADKLIKQDPSAPRAVLFAGPPGTGKTTIVKALARQSGFNLVELSDDIKDMYVGESERKLELALNSIEGVSPTILFIDEIDTAFQNRTNASLDGGVSSNYLKSLFKFASRDDLRGKVLIAAATNCPQALDPAMTSRFSITIPLLENTPQELAAIFPKIEQRITGKSGLNPENAALLSGCSTIYEKGASPRHIFDIINHCNSKFGVIDEAKILETCKIFRCNTDRYSSAYSSLCAIKLTPFSDYFPWAGQSAYPMPWYLDGVILEDGSLNELILENKIAEFKQKARY